MNLNVTDVNSERTYIIEKIKKILREEGTVLFIGSGISLWSGLPSWSTLLYELADFVKKEGFDPSPVIKEIKNNKLLEAADIALNYIENDKQLFKQFIRNVCRAGEASYHEIHKKIVNLGPRCFITTNYDQLLEETLREHRKNLHFQPITNRQQVDCASIVQHRAKDYIFKPHGDLDDTESIILSLKHYKSLYDEKKYTLYTMEKILATRPVVFMGYSLEDPDFIRIIEIIHNNFKGFPSSHYAILPDVSKEKQDYYFREFGIRIISYETTTLSNGQKNHSKLLEFIEQLTQNENDEENQMIIPNESDKVSDTEVLSLVRYSAGVNFKIMDFDGLKFPLNISKENSNMYYKQSIDQFLFENNTNALIIGSPGSGKTHSFKNYCTQLANILQSKIISEEINENLVLPIYLDLKLYDGDIMGMIENQLPNGMDFKRIKKLVKVVIILDSFNEIPSELYKNNFEEDFSVFLNDSIDCRVLIGSRSTEGLAKYNFDEYIIQEIDYKFVEKYITKKGIVINGYLKEEVISLLRQPFFFKLFHQEKIILPERPTPNDLYKSYFDLLNNDFHNQFNIQIDLSEPLRNIAYQAMDDGVEALHYTDVITKVKSFLNRQNIKGITEQSIINWLIESVQLFVPLPGSRVSFFHQSITEYLAAMEMARIYRVTPNLLDKCLKQTRWDQTLLLALGFLDEENATSFIDQIFETDFELLLKAVKYIEINRDEIVTKILNFIIKSYGENNNKMRFVNIDYLLRKLPINEKHFDSLIKIMKFGNSLGGVAAKLLAENGDQEIFPVLLKEMFIKNNDFNFGNYMGTAINKYLTIESCGELIKELIKLNSDEKNLGIENTFRSILKKFQYKEIIDFFLPWQNLNKLQLTILSEYLRDCNIKEANELLVEMVESDISCAYTSLYFSITFSKNFDSSCLSEKIIKNILNRIEDLGENSSFIPALLKGICNLRPEFMHYLKYLLSSSDEKEQLVILYVLKDIEEKYYKKFWEGIGNLVLNETCSSSILNGFENLDWENNIELIEKIFYSENVNLILSFLNSIRDNEVKFEITWELFLYILSWEKLVSTSDENEENRYWLKYLLGEFLCEHTNKSTHKIIELFNSSKCEFRDFLSNHYIYSVTNLTTDEFSPDALDYLVGQLYKKRRLSLWDSTIGKIASESFIEKYLFPLLETEHEILKLNLKIVLKQAGNKHRKRYLTSFFD
ncbi:hypothetical protein AN960_21010 [Bacillus sp. FJAT-25509]|uniref:SIR2 family protein n=1 Tax=Bacillus sp. FJAT-25509 TaxID=1712029 RepID=UPI0006F359EE|nr:SIR2 family protein [Bacillus sp. FJAT-25509]KQL33554.1 hypothetical protein AN960_21010 [Bacillus sp. FJAT-25509]